MKLKVAGSAALEAACGMVVLAVLRLLGLWRLLARRRPKSQGRIVSETLLDARSEVALQSIADRIEGQVACYVLHIETGQILRLNPRARFPLASLVKLSVAVALLLRTQAGERRLRSWVPVRPHHWRTGSGLLAQFIKRRSIRIPAKRLLELMLQESDNTATDALLDWLGGIGSVQYELRRAGFSAVAPQRSILQVLADLRGISPPPVTRDEWWGACRELPGEERSAAMQRFTEDPRDQASAAELANFIHALWVGPVLSEASRRMLFGTLSRTRSGWSRILRGLPPDSWLAHKTGTFVGKYAADAGIARLPDGSHLVIAAQVWSRSARRDEVIAAMTSYAVAHLSASG